MSPLRRTTPTLEVVDLRLVQHMAGTTLTLSGVSFRLYPQDIVVLSGKPNPALSALLSCLAGIVTPDGGTIRMDGESLTRRPYNERALMRTTKIGMIGRLGDLNGGLTVTQNAEQSQRLAGVSDRELVARLINDLGLTERAHDMSGVLTSSEAARAGVLVALAKRPQLLLADDPTADTDRPTSSMIANVLRTSSATDIATLLVTRDPALMSLADREISVEAFWDGP